MFDDLSLFFGEFAVDGKLAGEPVRGIYDAPAAEFSGSDGLIAQDTQFLLPSASVPAQSQGAVLELPHGRFRVRQHLPDGTGVSRLFITRASTST